MNQPHTLRWSPWLRLVLGLCLLIGLGVMTDGWARPAHAATAITVSTCDESHLDAAISQANSDNAGDAITFSCSGDITLTSTLTISGSMTLDGSGQSVTLDGGTSTQVLSVNSGVTFTLKALTIAHGSAFEGGGLFNNGGTVTISNSTFSGNSATHFADVAGGGLFNNGGTVTISNSTFSGNSATNGDGGGLENGGTVTISNSTFSGNSATNGDGGGLRNDGTVTISNSTFSGNWAGDVGGGLKNASGTVSISNSTVSSNASGFFGGGLNNDSGTVSIGGSIFSSNSPRNCTNFSTLTDQGYNLESSTSCGFTGTGSLQNTDSKLGPLVNNGGSTQTMALQQGSPAIDRIPAANCPAKDQRGNARPDDAESTCDIGAYESNYPPDTDLSLTNMPANITVNATSPKGAPVTYSAPAATDESGDSSTATVSCTPASGSVFPIGTTKVTCTATDGDDPNSPVSQSFTVTVNDTDLGLSNMPANITVNATSPQGASVPYPSPTVVDEESPLPTVNCSQASGSVFPIGTTTVACTVNDRDDTPSSVSQTFTVTVKGAAAQVKDLISLVNSFPLSSGLPNSLDVKLNAALKAANAGQSATACSDLSDFIGEVQAQAGKGLTTSQANQLIAAAKQVQAVLGC